MWHRDEQRLQRDGYVAAFRHPELIGAILSGPRGKIAVTYVEWAGSAEQSVVVPWMILSDRMSVEDFANRLAAAPKRSRGSRTSVSSGLLFAARQFPLSGAQSLRKTIDVSGDGMSNQGPPIAWVRDLVVA